MPHRNYAPSLTDQQLTILMSVAFDLSPEKRDTFLRRAYAVLRIRRRFNDDDLAEIAKSAIQGLQHTPAA